MSLTLFETTAPAQFRPQSGAVLSECGTYRYRLWRVWGPGAHVCFVMLNPSTADGQADDPTIRRCTGFAKSWGYDGFQVVNLFAYRSTDPKVLARLPECRVGPENDRHILDVANQCPLVICAWGRNPRFGRDLTVLRLLQDAGIEPHAIRILPGNVPAHPLMLPGVLRPVPLEVKAR
jgi:hypothetical protein